MFRVTAFSMAIGMVGYVSASASDYFPLGEQSVWVYDFGAIERNVEGSRSVGNASTTILRSLQYSPVEEQWQNFWTVDAESRVWLHGFYNITSDFGLRYDPPIEWIGTGSSWSTVTTARDLDSDTMVDQIQVDVAATPGVPVEVPAGDFETLELNVTIEPVGKTSWTFDLLGRRIGLGEPGKRSTSSHWYAPNVGLVRESVCCPLVVDDLSSYSPVGTGTVSFGRVKSSFKGN